MNSPPQPLCHTISHDQVSAVVHHFYERVLDDELLAPYFDTIEDWPRHEGYIVDFWWGVMGGEVATPRPGAMISGHEGREITGNAMRRWLELFDQSIEALIPPPAAGQWQTMARGIATMMGEHGLVQKEG